MYCTRCGTWAAASQAVCSMCGAPLPAATAAAASAAPSAPAFAAPSPTVRALPHAGYAGFWRRFWALWVDQALLFFPPAILRVALGMSVVRMPGDDFDGREWSVFAFTMAISWLYQASLEASSAQATLGGQLLGIRVTSLNGERISFLRASARFFATFVSAALCTLGYLFQLWTTRRQTLHDMISGCVLVRAESEPHPVTTAHAEMGVR